MPASSGYAPTSPPLRKHATLSFCQAARSSRTPTAILVSKRMTANLNDGGDTRLERSCGPSPGDWLRVASSRPGIEQIEAFFPGHAYDPHRHDTYAIGITLSGVQSLATTGGEGRIAWPGTHFCCILMKSMTDGRVRPVAFGTGWSIFSLARHFRILLGTSPYRYLVMRRLDRARLLLRNGYPIAEVAYASGFADQSHMTRQFRRAYGIPPGRWRSMQQPTRRSVRRN